MPSSNTQIEQNVSQQQTAYVDAANGDDATAQIGTHKAFKTIQAAINAVPAYSTPAEQRRWWQILVAPGTYDESLDVDTTRRKIAIFGVFNLGLFDGSAWGPTNNRNVTVRQTAGGVDGHRHSFMLGSCVPQGEAITTHPGYMGTPRISGKIIIDDTAIPGGTTADFYFNCEVFDQAATGVSLDGAAKAGGANIYLHRARMRTGVSGSTFLLQKAERCRFDGNVSIRSYSRLQDSYFAGNFTCTVVPTPDVEPYGFINCTFAASKVITTPALGFVLDSVTNYWLKTRGCTLGGATTKVITEDGELGTVFLTPEGGFAVKLTNNSGAPILKGSVVKADTANDDSIVLTAASDYDPIGVVYADIAPGAVGWVVVSGRAEILIDNAGGCNREDWLGVSTATAGRATASTIPSPPNADSHFREVGHTLRARGSAGLVFAIIHFN